MIEKRKIVHMGASRYLSLPQSFGVKNVSELLVVHDEVIGFAFPNIHTLDEKAFSEKVDAIVTMVKDARRVLQLEQIGSFNPGGVTS